MNLLKGSWVEPSDLPGGPDGAGAIGVLTVLEGAPAEDSPPERSLLSRAAGDR